MAEDLIGRLDRWLAKHRPGYYGQLHKGLTAAGLRKFQAKLRLQLPEVFGQFYRWRNGQVMTGAAGDLWNGWFVNSADDILWTRDMLDGLHLPYDGWWCQRWVPFLGDGGGGHICLDLEGTFTGTSGQLIRRRHDYEMLTVEYPSFEKWLEVFVGSLEEGLWGEGDGQSSAPLDEGAWKRYLRRHNPGYPQNHFATRQTSAEK